jgi:hypothetical protein
VPSCWRSQPQQERVACLCRWCQTQQQHGRFRFTAWGGCRCTESASSSSSSRRQDISMCTEAAAAAWQQTDAVALSSVDGLRSS